MSDSARSESPSDVDFSVIRTAIDMGHSMINQILNGIHYGSTEVRSLLYDECDFIVECKVCRSLFRSFPNFVAHKRVYCTETIEEKVERERTIPTATTSTGSEEETVIVEPEVPTEPVTTSTKTSTTGSPADGSSSSQSSVIQQVVDRQFAGKSREYQFYTNIAEQLEQSKASKVTNTVTMTAIPASSQAVFVSYNKGDKSRTASSTSGQNKSGRSSEQHGMENANQSKSSSPMDVDREKCSPKSKSITNICKRLASNQETDLGQGLSANSGVAGRQSRRARKSLPRKSTEEKLTFSSEADKGKSTNSASVDKSSPLLGAGRKTMAVSKINAAGNMISEAIDVNEKPSPVSPIKSSKNSNKDWMKFCDMKKNMCKKCGMQFELLSALKRHLKKTHGLNFGDVKCPKCGNKYESLGTMVRHMRINHKATPVQVERVLKVFEKHRELERKRDRASDSPASSSSQSSPVTSSKSSPHEKLKDKASPQLDTNSALYKALTGNNKKQSHMAKDNDESSKPGNTCNMKEKGPAQIDISKTQRTGIFQIMKQSGSSSEGQIQKPTSVSSDKQSNLKETKGAHTLGGPVAVAVSQRSTIKMQRETKSADDASDIQAETKAATKVPKVSPDKETFKNKKDDLPESDSGDINTRLKGEKVSKVDVAKDKPVTRAHREERRSDISSRRLSQTQSTASNVKPASLVNKALSATAANNRETKAAVVNKTVSEENNERSLPIASDIDTDKIVTDTEKPKPKRAKSESICHNEDMSGRKTVLPKSLRSRSESAHKGKEAEIQSRSNSRENHRATSPDTSKSDAKLLPEVSLIPVTSPLRTLPPGSCPTSPTPSLNSNSCDGYSSKFKMTVKEMAELVESTSLAKFATERKKKARRILNNTKAKSNKPIPTRLTKPMKSRVRRRILPVKKVYSTRLSVEDPEADKTGDSKGCQGNIEQSRKLLREMRRLQNSAGLVESKIYSSSSPMVSARRAYESDDSTTNYALKERKLSDKAVGGKAKSTCKEVKASPEDPLKARGRKETSKIRNSSKDRTGLDGEIAGAKAPAIFPSRAVPSVNAYLRDKSEERSSRNSSAERPKGRIREKQLDTVSNGDDSAREKLDNMTVSITASEDNDKVETVGASDESDSDSAKLAEDKQMAQLEKRRQKIELQITKTNSLRKKMLAAIKSVNNSKKIMHKKSPEQVEMKDETKTGVKHLKDNVSVKPLDDKDKAVDAHNHRTRLATGSIFFNSELLKLSPSKMAMDDSPRKLTDTKEHIEAAAASARRKLSLSPRKVERKQHERTRSEPMVFSLATGVKKCDQCGKVFWKLKTFRSHKCQKVGKKRVLSGSPSKPDCREDVRGRPQEHPGKKARVDTVGRGRVIGSVARVSLGRRIDKVASIGVNKRSPKKTSPSSSPKKSTVSPKKKEHNTAVNKYENKVEIDENIADEIDASNEKFAETSKVSPKPGSSKCDITEEDNSVDINDNNSDDSDFSGFSESDLQHNDSVEEFEFSDIDDYIDSSDEAMELQDEDNSEVETDTFADVGPDGLLYKNIGKKPAKSGTVEEIWVEKPAEEKIENRHYVRDPNNPSKVYCQSNKDISKIIDEKQLRCLRCNLQYTSLSNLRRHAIRHLGWKRYKCKTCTFTCYDKSECRIHYSRSHGIQLDMSRFLQFYVDLKREAAKKRNARRVTTIRRKGTVTSQDEDLYRKPRQTLVVKPSKAAQKCDSAEAVSERSLQLVRRVVKDNDSLSKLEARSDANTSLPQTEGKVDIKNSLFKLAVKSETNDSLSQSEVESNTVSEKDSALAKARLNLANVLSH